MNQRFYLLNGLNDPSLKNTYEASFPEEIQPELNKMVAAAQMDFSTMSMGQIHQFTLEVMYKLCRQHQYFSDIMNRKTKYTRACKKPYLEIKCREKTCHCSPKKKKALQTHTKEKRRPLKFFKRSQRRGKSRGQRCFISNQTGHFAKNCPKKSQKAIRLISHLQIGEYDDIESLYSEQSEPDEETEFALNQTDSSDEESSAPPIPIFSIQEEQSIKPAIPQPCVEIQVLAKKFEKPIKVIAFIDTGAQRTMMDPDILPQEYWKNEVAYFVAVDGKVFRTDLVTHAPISIKNEAQVWGTFEAYPLEESYRHQLARHLCEINNYLYKTVDPNLPSSSQRPKESYPTDRIIPQNTNDGKIRTKFYVPEPVFQKTEDLADDYSSLNRDWEDYNAQLMEDLLHKKRYRYHHLVYGSLTRSEV
ncbi:polyprotein [Glycine max]|nr:polyprotein [Glycine max]